MSGPETTPAGGTVRPLPSMVADLRGLAKHIHAMNSGSGDAALLRDAANYIEGATGSLREHMDMLRRTRSLLADAISDIAEQCDATYMTRDKHPDQMRRYDRDMEIVRKARALLDGGEAPCPDNLRGNADIARIALHGK